MIDDVECVHFLAQLTAAYQGYPPHLILNFGRSNWYLVMVGDDVVLREELDRFRMMLTEPQKPTFHSSP
jgi:hypothetical protein